MARVKLSEFRAKSLLVPSYQGVALQFETLKSDIANLDTNECYIIKVDQGIKKRGKQGLIRLNIDASSAETAVRELAEKGFNRFIAEPMLAHDDSEERYVSFERFRDGLHVLYSEHGGMAIEDNPKSVKEYTPETVPLPRPFVDHIVEVMNKEHLAFLEINPLIVRDDECILLDAAVLADSAGEYQASWSSDDVVDASTPSEAEKVIAEMNDNSPAAFTFRILNPDGALWLLLSGGGASITIADEAMNAGKAELIGNYGEYSGGPTSEETYLYTQNVLKALFTSNAPRKAIVIAGGVANFTDVAKTFKGVIQALSEVGDQLQKAGIKIFVRRGGPNEKEGLALMEKFLHDNDLYGSVHGSDTTLTDVIHEALEAIDA